MPHGHWHISTFIVGLRHDGFVAPCVVDGAIDGDLFVAYVKRLAPVLRPGNVALNRSHRCLHTRCVMFKALSGATRLNYDVHIRLIQPVLGR